MKFSKLLRVKKKVLETWRGPDTSHRKTRWKQRKSFFREKHQAMFLLFYKIQHSAKENFTLQCTLFSLARSGDPFIFTE